jgi:hypothetical protein
MAFEMHVHWLNVRVAIQQTITIDKEKNQCRINRLY